MKKINLYAIAITMITGCSEPALFPSDDPAQRARCLIGVLSTNSSVRAIRNTEAVGTNIAEIADLTLRRILVDEWKDALLGIRMDDRTPTDRHAVAREISMMLCWNVAGSLWKTGASFDDVWSVHFATLEWLSVQCREMRPALPEPGFDWRREREKWHCYGGVVEWRECVIENLERDGFDERIYKVGPERMTAVRKKFDKVIGRPSRPAKEIKHLGIYAKQALKIIDAERDAALKRSQFGERTQ